MVGLLKSSIVFSYGYEICTLMNSASLFSHYYLFSIAHLVFLAPPVWERQILTDYGFISCIKMQIATVFILKPKNTFKVTDVKKYSCIKIYTSCI